MRRAEHRARAATTLIFFLTGAVFAAWSTRLPTIKEDLHLSDGALALAILGLEAGAIAGRAAGGAGAARAARRAGLPAGGAVVARAGSRAALRGGFVAFPVGLVAVGFAGGLVTLGLALATM